MNEPIAYIEFTDGACRPVYEDQDGHQFIVDRKGRQRFGVWFIPREECDEPVIVDDREF